MCTINDDPIMYGSWDMEHNRQNFLSFWTIFLHFYPANNPKNQTFEKMKKPPGDIITLDVCIINNNHMMHGSWDIEHNGQNFLSFWTIFCPFSPLTTQKIKNLKKWKKKPGDIILHKCAKNDNHMMYGSWDMKRDRQNFLSFWTVFCRFTPLTTWKIKILKNWKNHMEISSFYTSAPKIMIICFTVP